MGTVKSGDKIKFEAFMADGSTATWTAIVIRVIGHVTLVCHPESARAFLSGKTKIWSAEYFPPAPFSDAPCRWYKTSRLEKGVVRL
jgi:hypothetical protein